MKNISTVHRNILIKKLTKEGIDLERDKMSISNDLVNHFHVYKMQNGKYAVLPIKDQLNSSNLAYYISTLNQLQCIATEYETPILSIQGIFYVRNESSILNINNYHPNILNDVVNDSNIGDLDIYKFITIKILGYRQSDENILAWIYYTGVHIKAKFSAYWALRKIALGNITYFVPLIIGVNKDVWNVGEFCHQLYFKYNKMSNISFDSFYKGKIERYFWKPKISNLNIQNEDILFIEFPVPPDSRGISK